MTEPPRVTVYTRTGCPACVRAERDVERICTELGHGWTAVDVDSATALRAEYGDRVPVIVIDGREHGFWKVEEDRFRAALAGRPSPDDILITPGTSNRIATVGENSA